MKQDKNKVQNVFARNSEVLNSPYYCRVREWEALLLEGQILSTKSRYKRDVSCTNLNNTYARYNYSHQLISICLVLTISFYISIYIITYVYLNILEDYICVSCRFN